MTIRPGAHCLFACAAWALRETGRSYREEQLYFLADGPVVEYAGAAGALYPPALDRIAAALSERLPVSVRLMNEGPGESASRAAAGRAEAGRRTLLVVDSRALAYKSFYRLGESRNHTVVLRGIDAARGAADVADLFLLEPSGEIGCWSGETDWRTLAAGVRHALWFEPRAAGSSSAAETAAAGGSSGRAGTFAAPGEPSDPEADMAEGLVRFLATDGTESRGLGAYRQWFASIGRQADEAAGELDALCREVYYRLRIGSVRHLLGYTKASLGTRLAKRFGEPLEDMLAGWKRLGASMYKAGAKQDREALRRAANAAAVRLDAMRGLLTAVAETAAVREGGTE